MAYSMIADVVGRRKQEAFHTSLRQMPVFLPGLVDYEKSGRVLVT